MPEIPNPTASEIASAIPEVTDATVVKSGGFKVVYRATINGRTEALKLVHIPSLAGIDDPKPFQDECLARVRREVQTLADCKDSGVVKLGNVAPRQVTILGESLIAYSEEFLGGSDLRAHIKQGWRPDESELRTLFITLLRAIKSLWELPARVIHRDIKPDNIIRLDDDSRPFVLLDLGIAFAVFDTALTVNPEQRLPVGTFPYLAPEMFQPNFRDTIDYRSDLYAAALTIYECATGRHPLAREGEYFVKTLTRILQDTPPPLQSVRTDLSPVLCEMVDGMLKKRPPLRPANLAMLIKKLQF